MGKEETIEEKICRIHGGDPKLMIFEDKWNPVKLLADMRKGLDMDKDYSNLVAGLYQRLYNAITDRYVQDKYYGIIPKNDSHNIKKEE